MPTEVALGELSQGRTIVWRGDFHAGKTLLVAIGKAMAATVRAANGSLLERHLAQRADSARRAEVLSRFILDFSADGGLDLPRAPDVRLAVAQAWDLDGQPFRASLRDLLGAIGAFEWRKNGVPVPALGKDARVHPHYGVFAPVRGEYVTLIAEEPLPGGWTGDKVAFDVGTGTGVLAAVLAKQGARRIVATDDDERTLTCARENLARLRVTATVQRGLFPDARADLVVCNPPWLPGAAVTALDRAVYDPESQMLRGFLNGLADHLASQGEGWLVMSDLAERIGLRGPTELAEWIEAAGLRVVHRRDTRPTHPRTRETSDPLHVARAAEITTIWRLAAL